MADHAGSGDLFGHLVSTLFYSDSMKRILVVWFCVLSCELFAQEDIDRALEDLLSGEVKEIDEETWKRLHQQGVKEDYERYKQTIEAHRQAAAAFYSTQVKWSILRPQSHGGYPYRTVLFRKEFERYAIYKVLKKDYETDPTPLKAYTLVCPAIIARDEELIAKLRADLKEDPYLSARLEERFENWQNYLKNRIPPIKRKQ